MTTDNTLTSTTVAESNAQEPSTRGRVSTAVPRENLTQELVNDWLEIRTDVFEIEGVEAPIVQENLYWKRDSGLSKAGDLAGTRREIDQYYSITFKGFTYSGKMLINFMRTGEWVSMRPAKKDGQPAEKATRVHVPRTAVAPLVGDALAKAKAEAKAKREAKAAEKKAKEEAAAAKAEPVVVAQEASQATAEDTSDIGGQDAPFEV